jgi:hypothetical protein
VSPSEIRHTRLCRHCGTAVNHDAPAAICRRCASLPVAERGRREPGSDDDRNPQRTTESTENTERTYEIPGRGNPAGGVAPASRTSLSVVSRGQLPSEGWGRSVVNSPAAETEEARRERLYQARVARVNESFLRGRRCLLARALDPVKQEWARCEPKK